MADPYSTGGGGGRSTAVTEVSSDALDQLYEITYPFSSNTAQQLNEMIRLLHRAATSTRTILSTGVGNVTGPTSAIDGNIAIFSGITGKIIADGGARGALSSLVDGTMKQARIQITDAQMKTLNTVPVDVIDAPGTNKIAIPIMCWVHSSIVTGYNTANSCSLRYSGIAVDIGNAQTLASTTAEDSYKYISIQGTNFNSANQSVVDTKVQIRATGNLTGGNVANFFNVIVTYIDFKTNVAGSEF